MGLLAGAVLGLLRGAGLVVGTFLVSAGALGPVSGLGAAGLVVLGRLRPGLVGAAPLVFLNSALGRLNSVGDFVRLGFFVSAGFTSFLTDDVLFVMMVGFGTVPPAAEVMPSLGATGLALTEGRGLVPTGVGVLFSGVFSSALFGFASFVSLGVAVLTVTPRRRLGVEPAVRAGEVPIGFLAWPGVAESGFLGLVAAGTLPFGVDAAAFDGVAVVALTFFSGLAGSSLLGGAVMSFPALASTGSGAAAFSVSGGCSGC